MIEREVIPQNIELGKVVTAEETTLDTYRSDVFSLAESRGVSISRKRTLRNTVMGSGMTTSTGESGEKYSGEPMQERIRAIQYSHGWGQPSVEAHELKHVEQRLTNPAWENTSLAKMEIDASLFSLRITHGVEYPIALINQQVNLLLYFLKDLSNRANQKIRELIKG